ncbi:MULTISPECIES: TetR/AcrR family transcriptional regulator [Streptomyces]|uniref:TetR/AcrR family transcriptional regulator n=1 Tax=Streptomyces gilvifuscus TaxID=1550617 RepID=A0ABT5G6B7_9ACTN|nr:MULTISPECIES: TetR/AcrR family transcriptional regulator [Streptomyces]MBK3645769.1 TetR/AcrR family transcriptional regulator [Streptomyces sp. MBT33]MDC2960335.1 TetR/AcrR family transcriptional regulator [Streptomyces gilvifuscus]
MTSSTRGRRGSYSVGIARRQKIVEAAAQRFAQEGYHRTALNRIADDVGITEGGLLHHFRSKKHLLLAVMEHRFTTEAQWWERLPARATGRDILRAMVAATERHLAEPGLIELFVLTSAEAADPDSAAHALFTDRYRRAVDALAQLLRTAQDDGTLREDTDCHVVARECIAVSDGLQLQWVISGGALDLTGAVRTHADRIARTVLPDGEGL